MGKQVSKILRARAEQLYGMYKENFSTDYEKNKKALDDLKIFPNKMSRNIVAGIIVKLAEPKEL